MHSADKFIWIKTIDIVNSNAQFHYKAVDKMTLKTKNLNINYFIWQHIIETLVNLYLQQHDTNELDINIIKLDKI